MSDKIKTDGVGMAGETEFKTVTMDYVKPARVEAMTLSDQALGAVMMALQRSLMEQSDIVPVLKGFEFVNSEHGLTVRNPPVVSQPERHTFVGIEEEDDGGAVFQAYVDDLP